MCTSHNLSNSKFKMEIESGAKIGKVLAKEK
jgi:hypothetical protein